MSYELYEPAGWFVDTVDAQIPGLVEQQRKNGHSAVRLANIFLDKSTDGAGGQLSDEDHVQALALLTALLLRRLAVQAQ